MSKKRYRTVITCYGQQDLSPLESFIKSMVIQYVRIENTFFIKAASNSTVKIKEFMTVNQYQYVLYFTRYSKGSLIRTHQIDNTTDSALQEILK